MKEYFIYTLKHHTTNEVFYLGVSSSMEKSLKRIANKIKHRFSIDVIEACSCKIKAQNRFRYWRNNLISNGADLVNKKVKRKNRNDIKKISHILNKYTIQKLIKKHTA
jgi:hypothetical protein